MKCFDCDYTMEVLAKGALGTSWVCNNCEHISIVTK